MIQYMIQDGGNNRASSITIYSDTGEYCTISSSNIFYEHVKNILSPELDFKEVKKYVNSNELLKHSGLDYEFKFIGGNYVFQHLIDDYAVEVPLLLKQKFLDIIRNGRQTLDFEAFANMIMNYKDTPQMLNHFLEVTSNFKNYPIFSDGFIFAVGSDASPTSPIIIVDDGKVDCPDAIFEYAYCVQQLQLSCFRRISSPQKKEGKTLLSVDLIQGGLTRRNYENDMYNSSFSSFLCNDNAAFALKTLFELPVLRADLDFAKFCRVGSSYISLARKFWKTDIDGLSSERIKKMAKNSAMQKAFESKLIEAGLILEERKNEFLFDAGNHTIFLDWIASSNILNLKSYIPLC